MLKKCKRCGKEDDFVEDPICDDCATKIYSSILLSDLIGLLKGSTLEPKEELNKLINELENRLNLNMENIK
jgi:hypothetical protein